MKKIFFVILIVFIASFLRLWMLNTPDVQEDERHYIDDAFRYLNSDPFISVRYHALNHPQPSVGHPFLYQLLLVGVFKTMGISVFTSRLVSVFSGILTVVVLFFFNKELGGRVSFLAAFLLAIVPMAVRFNRLAYLDSLLALFITVCALCAWRYLKSHNWLWLLIGGLSAGMAISAKLNGSYVIVMFVGMILLIKSNLRRRSMAKIKELSLFLIPAGFIAILLNDPRAYIDGIINPSDPTFKLFDDDNLARIFDQYISFGYLIRFLATNVILLSPVFLLIVVYALRKMATDLKNTTNVFFILWLLPLLVIFFIHGIDNTGAYRWIPLLPPLVLLASYKLSGIERLKRDFVVWLVAFTVLPFLILYGLSLSKLPFANIPITHNRVTDDTYYQDVIKKINYLTPKNGKIVLLPQNYYPLFALRKDLSWSYSLSNNYDFYVLDKPVIDESFFENNEYLGSIESNQDDIHLERFFYKRHNL